MRRIVSLVLLSLLLAGCFSYVPQPADALPRGATVRMALSQPVDVRLGEVTANEVVTVSGEMIRADSAVVALSATLLRSRNGYESLAGGETVLIPRERVREVERKRLSPLRTGLVASAVVVVLALIASQTGFGGGREGGGSPQPR